MAAAAFAAVMSGCGKAAAQAAAKTGDDAREINLTIYKDDFAMVSEARNVDLLDGHSRLAIDQVSKQLDANSVLFDWPGSKAEVVATTYDLGVADGSRLLSRLNGQQVEMRWPSDNGKPGEVVSGRLEAAEQGGNFALRTKDKLYVNPSGTIVASANAAASTLPQLSIEVESKSAGSSKLGVSYLTRGMSWSADYVAKLDSNADKADIECWATVTNTTGIPFPAAKLTLMAGSPNRAAANSVQKQELTEANAKPSSRSFARDAMAAAPSIPAASVGEMYAYKVPSTATIGQDQMNRVSMLGTRSVPVKRDYAIRIPGLAAWGYEYYGSQPQGRVPATLSISFENTEASNLGLPLPSGTVRVYDQKQFVGAATIGDTAKKEHVHMTLSNVFDVYSQYRVVKSKQLDKHTVRKTVEAVLHNEKPSAIDVRVVEGFDGRWTTVEESDKGTKLDSETEQWTLHLKPGEERVLSFTVDLKV